MNGVCKMKKFMLLPTTLLIMSAYVCAAFAEITSAKLGDIEIFSLVDAQGEAPVSLLIGATDEQIEKYVPKGKLQSQILAFLVKLQGKNILFDTGLGEAKGGKMMNALRDLEVKPEDINSIYLTHLHPDHIGGLTENGKAIFPKADIYVSRIEKDWWFNDRKDENVIKTFEPYEGRINIFEFGDELSGCIKAIDASGHTPGHTAFHVKTQNGEILVVGDILHFAEIMLDLPDVAVKYDVDPVKAPKAREFILDMAAENNIPIAGMHFSVPGLWRIQKEENKYKKISLTEIH